MQLTLSGISPDTWSHTLGQTRKVLGRDHNVDIVLEHLSVSRRHCQFWTEHDKTYVEDCGSSNGTYVNGVRILKTALQSGDTIVVGNFELMAVDDKAARETVGPDSPCEGDSTWSSERRLASEMHQHLRKARRFGLPGMLVETCYRSGGVLGGDAFECFELGRRCVITAFDPMVHGPASTLAVLLLLAKIQHWISLAVHPGKCLELINDELVSLDIDELYIGGILGIWDPVTYVLVYSSAGQHHPVLIRNNEVSFTPRDSGGLPLGIRSGEHYGEAIIQLKPRDRLFIFTDGLATALRQEYVRTEFTPHAELVGQQLMEFGDRTLFEQVNGVVERRKQLFDDVLLAGMEISDYPQLPRKDLAAPDSPS